MENRLRFLKKLNTELSYDPVIPLLGIYLEKTKIPKDTCIPVFIATLLGKTEGRRRRR